MAAFDDVRRAVGGDTTGKYLALDDVLHATQ
jgi:hypothetical protein